MMPPPEIALDTGEKRPRFRSRLTGGEPVRARQQTRPMAAISQSDLAALLDEETGLSAGQAKAATK